MRRILPTLALLSLAAVAASGCVRRTLEITSEPAGAQVIVNGHAAGVTPTKIDFRFTGTYLIELRRGGYEPVTNLAPVPAKFYEFAGPDFVAEVLWPGVVVDDRHVHYKLVPLQPLDRAKLMASSKAAAAEAERLIPVLEGPPEANPNAKDRDLLSPHHKARKKDEKKDEKTSTVPGQAPKPPETQPAQPGPESKPPRTNTIPAPEDVPEIEKNR